jgi:hypothetical protein
LFLLLGSLREDSTVLDALDRAASDVVEECSHLMPIQDKTAANNAAALDFQWITGEFKQEQPLGTLKHLGERRLATLDIPVPI